MDAFLEEAWTDPIDAANDAVNWIDDAAEDVGDAFVDAAEDVGDAFVDAGDAIVGAGDLLVGGEAAALEAIGIDTAAMTAEEIVALAAVLLL